MAYGAALERRFGGNPIEGSNPSLSANFKSQVYLAFKIGKIEAFMPTDE